MVLVAMFQIQVESKVRKKGMVSAQPSLSGTPLVSVVTMGTTSWKSKGTLVALDLGPWLLKNRPIKMGSQNGNFYHF